MTARQTGRNGTRLPWPSGWPQVVRRRGFNRSSPGRGGEWTKIAMPVWVAIGGSPAGFHLINAGWQRNPAYAEREVRERWAHYFKSPPTKTGAGKIFRLAQEAQRQAEQDYEPESGRW